jgi:virginiamycin B lyase
MPERLAIFAALAVTAVAAIASPVLAGTIGHLKEFPIPTANSQPRQIAAGPDGALWFTEFNASKIGRITTSGEISEFPTPTASVFPFDIAAGADGALWFTESASQIGRLDPTNDAIQEFPLPTPGETPRGITAGPDGAVWFTEHPPDAIGRITPTGQVTEFALPPGSGPSDITTGPDGALWFTEPGNGVIGRMTTTGALTTFSGAGFPVSITTGRTATCGTRSRSPKRSAGSRRPERSPCSRCRRGALRWTSPRERMGPCGSPSSQGSESVESPPVG